MGNTFTLLYNKLQYKASNYLSDPEADNHAKQVAAQAAQDKATAERQKAADINSKQAAADTKVKQEEAAKLAAKSKFSSPGAFFKKVTSSVLGIFNAFILICLALYGGKIAANNAIGYNVPFRLLSFFYGMILWPIVIIIELYHILWKGESMKFYAWLPVSQYQTGNRLHDMFLKIFCYKADAASDAAREEVIRLYKNGYSASIGTAIAVAATAATAATAASAANTSNHVNKTNNSKQLKPVPTPSNSKNAPKINASSKPSPHPENKPSSTDSIKPIISATIAQAPTKPETPPTKPETPPTKPETPPTKPETPPTKPETPPTKPGTPAKPGTPPAKPGTPVNPGTPPAKPGTPPAKPGTPPANPGTPVKPGTPPANPGTPVKPGTPPANPGTPSAKPAGTKV